MTTMVNFRVANVDYCLPVSATRAVRVSSGIMALPAAGPDVAGIIPGNPPLTVISPLGRDGDHVLIVAAADKLFGLLVDAVTGLQRIADAEISPAPEGQERPLISGTIDNRGQLILVADPDVLAGQL